MKVESTLTSDFTGVEHEPFSAHPCARSSALVHTQVAGTGSTGTLCDTPGINHNRQLNQLSRKVPNFSLIHHVPFAGLSQPAPATWRSRSTRELPRAVTYNPPEHSNQEAAPDSVAPAPCSQFTAQTYSCCPLGAKSVSAILFHPKRSGAYSPPPTTHQSHRRWKHDPSPAPRLGAPPISPQAPAPETQRINGAQRSSASESSALRKLRESARTWGASYGSSSCRGLRNPSSEKRPDSIRSLIARRRDPTGALGPRERIPHRSRGGWCLGSSWRGSFTKTRRGRLRLAAGWCSHWESEELAATLWAWCPCLFRGPVRLVALPHREPARPKRQ
jgi:hypothetical protein